MKKASRISHLNCKGMLVTYSHISMEQKVSVKVSGSGHNLLLVWQHICQTEATGYCNSQQAFFWKEQPTVSWSNSQQAYDVHVYGTVRSMYHLIKNFRRIISSGLPSHLENSSCIPIFWPSSPRTCLRTTLVPKSTNCEPLPALVKGETMLTPLCS